MKLWVGSLRDPDGYYVVKVAAWSREACEERVVEFLANDKYNYWDKHLYMVDWVEIEKP